MTIEQARAYVSSVRWTFARTRARTNPHHYIIERVEGGPEFSAFVELIRAAPIRRWRGGRYHCLTIDQRDYWITNAGSAGLIVNRKPSDRAGWDEEPPPTRDRRELIEHDVEHGLLGRERADELLRDARL